MGSARRRYNANGDENELVFQARVVGLFRVYGFERIYHAPAGGHRGRVSGEQLPEGRGFPDLIAIKAPRLVAVELKASERLAKPSRLRPGQMDWLEAFGAVGFAIEELARNVETDNARQPAARLGAGDRPSVEAYLWSPEEWDELHDVIRGGLPRRGDLDPVHVDGGVG